MFPLLVLLVFFSHGSLIECLSQLSGNQCAEVCGHAVDGTTHCYPAYFTECVAPGILHHDLAFSQGHNPPTLHQLSVQPLNNSRDDQYSLHISVHVSSANVTQIQISLSQFFRREQTNPKNHLRSGYCRVYNISSQDPDVSWTITDACWDSIQTDSVYALSLTSNADQLTYFISTPANFSFLLDPPSLPDWHTVVAIAVLPSNKSILTSFQLAPASSAVTSYLVHLHDVETPPHYSLYQTITNESWTVFPSLPPLKVEYQLTIKINNCDQCVETWASSILLPVAPEKVTTPKPLVSPKAVITMATDDYSDLSTWTDRMSSDDYEATTLPSSPGHRGDLDRTAKIVGGVVGGLVCIALLGLLAFCVWKQKFKKRDFTMRRFHNPSEIALEDDEMRSPSSILIIYSYDCDAHERVVVELATYLKHVFCCQVFLDIWEQAEIQEKGALLWLQEKFLTCNHILIICSAGARYKCAKNKQFRLKQSRPLPETFSLAVQMATERLRSAKRTGVADLSNVIVAYFEYSGHSSIPPNLDTAVQIPLMRDVMSLYSVAQGISDVAKRQSRSLEGVTADTFYKTATGQQLYDALISAENFFQENPDWLGLILEPVSPVPKKPSSKRPSREGSVVTTPVETPLDVSEIGSQEDLLGNRSNETPALEDPLEGDVLLRRRKDDHPPSPCPSPLSQQIPPAAPGKAVPDNWPLVSNGFHDDQSVVDDDEQLQKDIDALNNFDNKWFKLKPASFDFSALTANAPSNGAFDNSAFHAGHLDPTLKPLNNNHIDSFVVDFSGDSLFESSMTPEASPKSTTIL